MEHEIYKSVDQNPNMKDYEETVKNFSWDDVEKNFSWSETGKVNIAYEAIDRHEMKVMETKLHYIIVMTTERVHLRSKK